MISISRASIAALILLCTVTVTPARGFMLVEDFDAAPSGGFNNPAFVHSIEPEEIGGNPPNYEFITDTPVSPPFALGLSPGMDRITFNLNAGEFVDYAEVWMAGTFRIPPAPENSLGEPIYPASFQVLGLDESGDPHEVTHHAPAANEDWHFYSTADAGFASISEIRLASPKIATFDDLGVNVTPEPATLGLMALGLVGLIRRRPRKNRASPHP